MSENDEAGGGSAAGPALLAPLFARLRPVGLEFMRFGLVGTAGFLVDASILQLCLSWLGIGPYAGRAISFAVAVTFTWFCNRHFTFRQRGGGHWLRQWSRFVLLMLAGGGLNYGTYAVLVAWAPPFTAYPVLAVAAGSLAGMMVNFATARYLVFGRRPSRPQGNRV